MENYTFRLKSGQDLFEAIQEFVDGKNIESGCVVSAVGSLRRAVLRFANRDSFSGFDGFFETVSVTSTVPIHGSHLHISISDKDGKTVGRHMELGHKIFTTAGIAVLAFDNEVCKRESAEDSGYEELAVYVRQRRG